MRILMRACACCTRMAMRGREWDVSLRPAPSIGVITHLATLYERSARSDAPPFAVLGLVDAQDGRESGPHLVGELVQEGLAGLGAQ